MHLDPEIQAALDALPPDFRVAVVLCDLEQLSYEEIAATLGIKVGTVRSRIHRGRVLLREALAHRAPGIRPVEPRRRPWESRADELRSTCPTRPWRRSPTASSAVRRASGPPGTSTPVPSARTR